MARIVLHVIAALLSLDIASVAAQADGCPAPLVEVRNQVNGSEVNRALLLRRQLPPGGLLGERALNRVIDANGGSIRFVQGTSSTWCTPCSPIPAASRYSSGAPTPSVASQS